MKTPNLDVDAFVEALRADLPDADDEARVRARLLAGGVLVTAALTSSSVSAALGGVEAGAAAGAAGSPWAAGAAPGAMAASGAAGGGMTGGAAGTVGAGGASLSGAGGVASGLGAGGLGAGAPAALVKVGLLSKVMLLPIAAKLGVAATLAVTVATGVPLVLSRSEARRANDVGAPTSATAAGGAVSSRPPTAGSDAASKAEGRGGAARLAEAPPGAALVDEATRGRGAAVTPSAPVSADAAAAARLVAPKRSDVSERVEASLGERALLEAGAVKVRPPTPRASGTKVVRAARAPSSATQASDATQAPSANGAEARAVRELANSSERGRTELVRSSTLGEETRLMEHAMLALGEGDRDLARRSLEEHARRFPRGLLLRERERALERLRRLDAGRR